MAELGPRSRSQFLDEDSSRPFACTQGLGTATGGGQDSHQQAPCMLVERTCCDVRLASRRGAEIALLDEPLDVSTERFPPELSETLLVPARPGPSGRPRRARRRRDLPGVQRRHRTRRHRTRRRRARRWHRGGSPRWSSRSPLHPARRGPSTRWPGPSCEPNEAPEAATWRRRAPRSTTTRDERRPAPPTTVAPSAGATPRSRPTAPLEGDRAPARS